MSVHQLYIPEGLLLGLVTGPLCVVSCGPAYAPFLMQKGRNTLQSIYALLQISAGRFLAYLAIGFGAGALGLHLQNSVKIYFTVFAYITFSIILVLSSLSGKRCDEGCRKHAVLQWTERPFLLGFATGISFCPSFFIALTSAIDRGGALAGALLFGAFFIGTNIYFLPFVLFGMAGKTFTIRRVARILSIGVALVYCGIAVFLLMKNL